MIRLIFRKPGNTHGYSSLTLRRSPCMHEMCISCISRCASRVV
ncbi:MULTISPECIES: hypothetical protein [Bacteroides]